MIKWPFIALFVLTCFQVNGNHRTSGEISWRCLGNNQYEFTMVLYMFCTPSLYDSLDIEGPQGPINLKLVRFEDVLPVCVRPEQSAKCFPPVPNSLVSAGALTRRVYLDTTTLSGSPPTSGWEFSFSFPRAAAPRNTGSQGMYIKAIMYPDPVSNCSESAQWRDVYPVIDTGVFHLSNFAISPKPGDSLFYDWYAPFNDSVSSIVFHPGYSASAPFPDTDEDSANGRTTLNHQTGEIRTLVHAFNSSLFLDPFSYGVEVECWRQGHLISRTFRDNYVLLTPGYFANNSPPEVNIDSSSIFPKHVQVDSISSGFYRIKASLGDTLSIDFRAVDMDMNLMPVGTQQQWVTYTLGGTIVDSIFNLTSSLPTVGPIGNQFGLSGQRFNNINFQWVLDSSIFPGDTGGYIFQSSFRDDACPVPRYSSIYFKVVLVKSVTIAADTLVVCQGDSVQLFGHSNSGIYSWTPNLEISSTTMANPWVNPSTSRYYYLNDPNNPAVKDSVYVDLVRRKTFRLDTTVSLMTLVDSVLSGQPIWYYNGIPFSYPYDTLTPFGPGDYWVQLVTTSCKYSTDTVSYYHNSLSMADPNNGNLASDPLLLTGSWSAVFKLDQTAYGNLSEIVIPGIIDLSGKTGGYDVKVEIMDGGGQMVYQKDTNVAMLNGEILKLPVNPVNAFLNAGSSYAITVTGDTGYAFSVYENVQLPSTPWNGGMTITAMDIDGSGTTTMLPVILKVTNPVGLTEIQGNGISIYPNPVKDILTIEGAESDAPVVILDLTGRALKSLTLGESGKVDIQFLKPGIYLLDINGAVQKFQVK